LLLCAIGAISAYRILEANGIEETLRERRALNLWKLSVPKSWGTFRISVCPHYAQLFCVARIKLLFI
jgi:hypothetical protein